MGRLTVGTSPEQVIDGEKVDANRFRIEAIDGDVRFADRATNVATGEELLEGERITVEFEEGDSFFAASTGSAPAELNVVPQGLIVVGRNNTVQQTADRQFSTGIVGQTTVSSASSTAQLNGGTSQAIPRGSQLSVRALSGNASPVYLGFDSGVDDTNGYELPTGGGISLPVDDVADVYIYGVNSGDGVSFEVEQT